MVADRGVEPSSPLSESGVPTVIPIGNKSIVAQLTGLEPAWNGLEVRRIILSATAAFTAFIEASIDIIHLNEFRFSFYTW